MLLLAVRIQTYLVAEARVEDAEEHDTRPLIWRIQQMGKEGSKRVLNSGMSVNRECPSLKEWDGI